MNQKSKIEVEFGIPEHGWLPTVLKFQDYKLEIEISDVPRNPMTQLCDSLIQLVKGINNPEVIPWHLEPYCYHLQFKKVDTNFELAILESENNNGPTKLTFEIKGEFETVIMPFYRGLKKFNSKSYKTPHWDEFDGNRINELTKLIKEKEHNNI